MKRNVTHAASGFGRWAAWGWLLLWGLSPVGAGEVALLAELKALHPLNQVEPSPVLTVEFQYDKAPFPQVHASTIAETPTGLVAAFFGGTEEKDNDVCIWVTRQVAGQWTPVTQAADGVQHAGLRYPCWNPVLFQVPSGPLQLYYKCGPDPAAWWGMLTESIDGGATWSWPRRLPATIDGPVKNKPVLLGDGTLLCPSSTEHDGWTVHFERTRDFGRTWNRVGPVNNKAEFGAI